MKIEAEGGRIYLPKETREKHGEKFEMIDRGDKIVLFPIPDDPLEALREEVGETDKSARELVEEAREAMIEQAGR